MADEEEYLIEPLQGGPKVARGPEESGPHVVYKRSSLRHPHLDTACGVRGKSICLSGGGRKGCIPTLRQREAAMSFHPGQQLPEGRNDICQTAGQWSRGTAHLSLSWSDGPTVSETGSWTARQVPRCQTVWLRGYSLIRQLSSRVVVADA